MRSDLSALNFTYPSEEGSSEETQASSVNLVDRAFVVDFPATRYFGSKRKLLSWLHKILSRENFTTGFDPFGGTGSVSYLMGLMGKKAYYRDCFEWSSACARVLLQPQRDLVTPEVLKQFHKSLQPRKGYVHHTFKNAYFTDTENQWIDGALEALGSLKNLQLQDQMRYLIFQACLRKRPFNLFHRQNLNIRLSRKGKPSFGNHATWEKSFPDHMSELSDELAKFKRAYPGLGMVLPADDVFAQAPKADLVYLDPPYLAPGRRTESYVERYHFLEGLMDVARWSTRLKVEGRKVSLNDRGDIDRWASREQITDLLLGTISAYSDSIVVLSYPSNSLPSKAGIERFFRKIFRSVSVYTRARSVTLSGTPMTEVVYVGRP